VGAVRPQKSPRELNNVYDDPAYAKVVEELTQKLYALREQYKDSEELDQKYIELYRERGIIKEKQ